MLDAKRIGVLMGGPSPERQVSLRSGQTFLRALDNLQLPAVPLVWDDRFPDEILQGEVDIVLIALHGPFGEDGRVQGLLDIYGIPYTGSGFWESALCMHKRLCKRQLQALGYPVSKDCATLHPRFNGAYVAAQVGYPVVVKPSVGGSSIDVWVAQSMEELAQHLPSHLEMHPDSLIEPRLHGREITIGVVGTAQGPLVLPILDLGATTQGILDYTRKYTPGGVPFQVPAPLGAELTHRLQDLAKGIFLDLNLRGIIRVDGIVQADGSFTILEVNTLPGFTETSDIPAMAQAAHLSLETLVQGLLEEAQRC